jgi:hypothetical protein
MRLNVGDSVKVKEGISCPDHDSISISGWQGRIIEIDGDMIGIGWDSITLKQIPPGYIKECEKEGLCWTEMYLGINEIEQASPRDTESEAEQMADALESKFQWIGGDAEDQHIYKVIADADDPDEAWHDYLKKMLAFPFEAKVSEPQDKGPLRSGDTVQVLEIDDVNDLYGILVKVSQGRRRFISPLCDLAATDKKSANYLPVNDYSVWFANR